jgi:hypothetical protein
MLSPIRKLSEVRLWVLLVLMGFMLAGSACKSSDESCHPDSSNYPECLDEGPTG